MPIPNSKAVAGYLPNFLLTRFKLGFTPCYIHRLPLDIFVDHIFVHLCIEDIMRLRRVNKAFFLLTHEPVIWKRILRRLNVPLPPIRPTFRYALEATDFEVEQLVSRAISLEDNWRNPRTEAKSSMLFSTHYNILDMKLLPGGKYLIASVKDEYRYFLMVYCLDHPKGPKALARLPTQMKAYHLQAKYIKYKGEQVIMIAYVRRSWAENGPTNLDANDYGYRTSIDPPHPMVHELLCVTVNLEMLEKLSNPDLTFDEPETTMLALADKEKGPFCQVAATVASFPIDHVSLYDRDEVPFVALVQRPGMIVFIDLTANLITTFYCGSHPEFAGKPFAIKAFRYLPDQADILVFLSIQLDVPATDDSPAVTQYLQIAEIFKEPELDGGIEVGYPFDVEILGNANINDVTVHVSDHPSLTTIPGQSHPQHSDPPPPPISVFMENEKSSSLAHYAIWPSRLEEPTHYLYYYDLEHVCFQTRHDCDPLYVSHVVPGSLRAIVYTARKDDRKDAVKLDSIRRYISPEFQKNEYPIPRHHHYSDVMGKKFRKMPTNTYGTVPLDSKGLQPYKTNGLAAIAWDEGVGRLCLAAANTPQIEVVDFAVVVHPDRRFDQWKRAQGYLTS
ncbi:hypothetical protein D9615_001024 [Tricholomella constricta]|uniref:F-box domain-containing protein n=1 Tax=Tricholomella constricta TaxID=117010 RepID=A0A8H5HL15_9AGAR|nr:hypothetical protein D9615_001024 [Tricholomella constricta]